MEEDILKAILKITNALKVIIDVQEETNTQLKDLQESVLRQGKILKVVVENTTINK